MPEYVIRQKSTGRTMTVRGDRPPTPEEQSALFAQARPTAPRRGYLDTLGDMANPTLLNAIQQGEGQAVARGANVYMDAGPRAVRRGAGRMLRGEMAGGSADVLEGGLMTIAPVGLVAVPYAAAVAPMATATSIAGGAVLGGAAKGATGAAMSAMGASDDQSRLAGDVAGLVGAASGGRLATPVILKTIRSSRNITRPDVTDVATSAMTGGKAPLLRVIARRLLGKQPSSESQNPAQSHRPRMVRELEEFPEEVPSPRPTPLAMPMPYVAQGNDAQKSPDLIRLMSAHGRRELADINAREQLKSMTPPPHANAGGRLTERRPRQTVEDAVNEAIQNSRRVDHVSLPDSGGSPSVTYSQAARNIIDAEAKTRRRLGPPSAKGEGVMLGPAEKSRYLELSRKLILTEQESAELAQWQRLFKQAASESGMYYAAVGKKR